MRALLLAAGLGARLRPITNDIPKCLVPIAGQPLLQYWLDMLFKNGIERVLINTHYLSNKVEEFVAESPWRSSIDLVFEESLLGTGGTLRLNRAFFDGHAGILAHADNLSRFQPAAFIARHNQRPAGIEITMMTFEADHPSECGIVAENERGIVTGFFEKVENPPGTRANGAVYIFEPSIIEFLGSMDKNFIDLSTEVLPHYLGRMQTYFNNDYHRDIGTPENLGRAETDYTATTIGSKINVGNRQNHD